MSVLNCFEFIISVSVGLVRLACVSVTEYVNPWKRFSSQASHFDQAASVILFSEERATLIRARTLACVLCHRPNAYYD